MRKWLFLSLSVALVIAGANMAGAKEPKEPKEPKQPKKSQIEIAFDKLDTNGDHQISLDEFCIGKDGKPLEGKPKDAKEKIFKKWDADNSTQVSLEEFKLKGGKPKPPK